MRQKGRGRNKSWDKIADSFSNHDKQSCNNHYKSMWWFLQRDLLFWNNGPIKVILEDGRKYRIESMQKQEGMSDFSVMIQLKKGRISKVQWTEKRRSIVSARSKFWL